MPLQVIQLSDYSSNEISEIEDVEVNEGLQRRVPTTNMDGINSYIKMRHGLKIIAHMIL